MRRARRSPWLISFSLERPLPEYGWSVAQGMSLHPAISMRCYNRRMGAKLSTANRFLRNPAARERAVIKSVATSSAIEGIRAPFKRKAGGLYSMTGRLTRKKT